MLRSLGEDLKNIADELEATPEPATQRADYPGVEVSEPQSRRLPAQPVLYGLAALLDASILLAPLTFMWCVLPEEPFRR